MILLTSCQQLTFLLTYKVQCVAGHVEAAEIWTFQVLAYHKCNLVSVNCCGDHSCWYHCSRNISVRHTPITDNSITLVYVVNCKGEVVMQKMGIGGGSGKIEIVNPLTPPQPSKHHGWLPTLKSNGVIGLRPGWSRGKSKRMSVITCTTLTRSGSILPSKNFQNKCVWLQVMQEVKATSA